MNANPLAAIRTTCPYCGVGCGVLARPNAVVEGDPDHPANAGRLCSKGAALGETLGLDNRQLFPEMDGVRTEWTTALDRVAAGFRDTIAAHGPDSVALYVSGQLLTEDYYAANRLTKAVFGTANIDSNSRLCMASAVAGHRRAFGEDIVPGIYEDFDCADLIVLVGSNTAWCHPVLYQRMVEARAARGTKIVVIDPRRTASCEDADLHLPLAPGSDVALFSGLLAHLAGDDTALEDLPAVALALMQMPSAEATARRCGLPTPVVQRFFDMFAATDRVVTFFSQGVNQSSAGTDKVNAIINVHLLTGRIGKPGAGPFSITGQPNAMGGREVGALSNMLAAHLEWDRKGDTDLLSRYWATSKLPTGPGLKAVDLFRAVADKKIRAIWILATNPAASLPDSESVRAALAGCDFVVVSDCEANTDTSRFAHVRLPALAWGEKDGTVTNSERMISRQRAFLPAPGEARTDWWALSQVAARLGTDFGWQRPADIFREHARLSGTGNDGARIFDISALAGLDDAAYDALPPTRWPCPAGSTLGDRPTRLFGDGRYSTPDHAPRLVPTAVRAPATKLDSRFPLALLTGRVRDQWHTMTRTARAPRLMSHAPEPFLSMNPADAALPKPILRDGGLVEVQTKFGRAILRLRLDRGIRRGSIYAPMHWTDALCPTGRVNATVSDAVDPVSGQPELKYTPAAVRAFAAGWHAVIITRSKPTPNLADYTCIIPMADGLWRAELAGIGAPASGFDLLSERLAMSPSWQWSADASAGQHRAINVQDGTLQTCLFIAEDHQLPPRDWLASFFAAPLDDTAAAELMAAVPANGANVASMICVCHNVDSATICGAIRNGAETLRAIGDLTLAGTGCGSCRPELSALLAAVPGLTP